VTIGDATSTSVRVPVTSIGPAVDFLREAAGFRLLRIHPADGPREARLVRDSTTIDLVVGRPTGATIVIESSAFDPAISSLEGPDGIVIRSLAPHSLCVPDVVEETSVGNGDLDGSWQLGRAGMEYRDLVPSRLGGSIIASNIRIRAAGPVPDYVHFHDVLFQLIFCRRGWVKVVYEDQGEPFVLHAGECVTQPPGIRHRVLENSDEMEVVEIGYPAEHMTFVEHDLKLPNGIDPIRRWQGQSFVRHDRSNQIWSSLAEGVDRSDTGILRATNGLADVDLVRMKAGSSFDMFAGDDPSRPRILFVVSGRARVTLVGDVHPLNEGATLSLRSQDTATVSADEDTTLLRVTIDASRGVDHWRPMA
jgi:quercetin dioxygenase-like cupin family protein